MGSHLRQVITQAFMVFHTYPDQAIIYHSLIIGVYFSLFEFKHPEELEQLPRGAGDLKPIPFRLLDQSAVLSLIPRGCIRVLIFSQPTLNHDGTNIFGISPAFLRCLQTCLPSGVGLAPLGGVVTALTSELGRGENELDNFYQSYSSSEMDLSQSEVDSEAGDPSYTPSDP
ncbi:uncharacterized protein EI90DRAFT_3140802 [Cantharellus anzutake]|uniref:uncharacterized protein n=1 Tax=Cantharellus anzutake TaxID=1750568 RepID=UPI001908CFD7|nr:uncharacterized protein EI90DRAFT_3140802 [Cantharellus anzutake]KAF8309310.1 hypothetical protein EI90DRAFT_3140802 [Cantharellus anzutake]